MLSNKASVITPSRESRSEFEAPPPPLNYNVRNVSSESAKESELGARVWAPAFTTQILNVRCSN